MSTHRPVHLQVDPDAMSAVTFALQRTIDDLEARALVATRQDPHLGPASAVEYRTDIEHLAGLLGQLGHTAARPDPERAAVVWFDDTYTIEDGSPVRMTAAADLDRLLDQAMKRRRDGQLTPGTVVDLLAEATGQSTFEVAEQLTAARQAGRDGDRAVGRTPGRQLSRELSGPETSLR